MSPSVPFALTFASLWLFSALVQVWPVEPSPVAHATQAATASRGAVSNVPTSSEQPALQVELGIAGAWKLGHVCPVRLQLSPELRQQVTAVEIQSVDGDGVELIYRQEFFPEGPDDADDAGRTTGADQLGATGNNSALWMAIRIGRQSPDIEVRVLANEQVLLRQSLDDRALGLGLPSDQPLIVAIGSSMGVEALSRSSADGSNTTLSTVTITSAEQVPLSPEAFTACDLLLISASDPQLLLQLSNGHWSAIDGWLRSGGAGLISLGVNADELAGLSPLASLLPGPVVAVGRISNPAALETLVATEDPLAEFGCAIVEPQRGRVELSMTDSLSRSVPWWLTYSHGLGTVRFIASDLNAPAFVDWPDRSSLWGRLIAPYWERSASATSDQPVGETSYLGYDDMVGQLRATLDVFPQVRVLSFGQVAAILMGILLLIGPVDYFVSVKWLRRPEASWWIAGGTLLAVVAGLTWLLATIRPTQLHVNTAQIVDVDASPDTPALHGRLWSHVFSGVARGVDLRVVTATADEAVNVDWQGLPGHGLGGLLSPLSTDRGMPTYVHRTSSEGLTQLSGVGIPVAGTKCLTAHWSESLELLALSNLKELAGVDQLQGELANPLPVDLLEPVLFYHNWFYSLDSRIPAGQSITIAYDTIPKDISRRLNGRRMVDKNEATIKWNPADRESIDRLLELMMFYKSAAGQTYTSLANRYEQQLDYSNLLQTDRAILLGRLEQPWASVVPTVTESAGNSELQVQQDLNRTWCRIVIPVQPRSLK